MAVNANIGTAWISVVPSTDKLAPAIKDALKDAEKSAVGSGSSIGQGLTSGINKTLKAGVIGVGVAAGGVLAASITKGLGRLSGIDNAQAKLSGLGHEAAAVEGIMDDALASVKGTAFGLEDAATIAASAVAAGIDPGKDLQRTLKLTGDAATIAGTDLSTMGSIVNKVATSDMMQMDVANQMMDAGIPILQMVGEELGVTAEEARKMASDGEISFETFQSALEVGLGGAALKSGDTVQGAFANMGAAAGRFGAQLAAPIFSAAPAVFGSLGGAFDTLGEKLEPLIADFADWLAPRMESFATETIPKLVDGVMSAVDSFIEFGGWVKDNAEWIGPLAAGIGGAVAAIYAWNTATNIAKGVQAAFNAVLAANPIMLAVIAVAALTAGLVYFFTKTETGKKAWETFTTALADGWNWVTEKVGGGIDWLQEKFDKFTGWLSTAWEGITSLFKGDFTSELSDAFGIEEDNPAINFFFTIRDAIDGVKTLISDVGGYISGVWDILFKGDYTGLPFGLDEDSGLVDFFFTIRETAIKTGEVIAAVWSGIVTAGKVAFAILGTIVLTPLILTWNALASAWSWGYGNLIAPAIDAFGTAGRWLWENALSPAFSGITTGFNWVRDGLVAGWLWIDQNMVQPFGAGVSWAGEQFSLAVGWIVTKWSEGQALLHAGWLWIDANVFALFRAGAQWLSDKFTEATDVISARWDFTKNILHAGWSWIDANVFALFRAGTQWLADKFTEGTGVISERWESTKNVLHAGWTWIDENVFSKFRAGVDLMRSGAEIAMNGIGTAFDWLRRKTADPVNFVIETVYMGGIRKAWGAVAGLVGLEDLPKIEKIGGYASGGVLPGYSPGVDDHMFYSPTGGRIALSGGEAIMRPEWTRAVGGPAAVERMNKAARSGNIPVERHGSESAAFARGGVFDLGAFNAGGVIGAMINIVTQKYPQLTMTSGARPGQGGMHGAGLATDWSNGGGNTPAQLALAHDIAQTYPNSAELIYASPGWSGNIKNGMPMGAMDSPGGYSTAQAGRHDHHVHWGMTTPPTMPFGGGVFEGGSDGGGGGIWQSITGMVKGLWDNIIDKIPGYDGDTGGSFAELPGSWLSTVAGAAWDHIKSLADNIMQMVGGGSAGSVDIAGITGPVVDQVEQVFAKHGFTGAEWDAAKWIVQKESNWSTTATNPSSGAFGLFQFNPMGGDTLGTYLPSRSTDPAVQGDAGARYIRDRYGTPTAAKAFWEQNGWYDNGGVLPTGTTMVQNDTGKPEAILNPWQWSIFNRAVNNLPFLGESLQTVAKEIGAAFMGHDFGYGELARTLRNEEWAKALVSGSAVLGNISRDVGAALAPAARDAGEDYLATQATSALDVVGLGGLVPMGMSIGERVWDAYQASPYEVGFNGQSITVEIDAESDADLIRVSEFKRLADQVHGLDVKVNKRPAAASITRGGVM